MEGLFEREVFKVVDKTSVPDGMRIFGTRFIDGLKTVDRKTFEKSRLVAQNYRDKGSTVIATKAPTRLIVSLCAMFPNHQPYLRDIKQAYVQSTSNLERQVFLNPLAEMKIPEGKVLKVVKPLKDALRYKLMIHLDLAMQIF